MQIRELVQASGVPAKTIGYYESIGLLPPSERASNNYRAVPLDNRRAVALHRQRREPRRSSWHIAEILALRADLQQL